ncbi:CobW family GTP-binding protein [Marinomonas sp.]
MRYQGIKVSIITGFLGAGKTTLIHQLIAQAPPYEKWAVLLNEFGDIGLDSALLGSALGENSAVAIKEVAGGCVCCVTSAAFEQGLNQLIRQVNPDRILIEPSGLGHPKQILAKLRSEYYQQVLAVTGVFCVLDARKLSDSRYLQHEIFRDQLAIADGIIPSHEEAYSSADQQALKALVGELNEENSTQWIDRQLPTHQWLDIGLKDTPTNGLAVMDSHNSHDHGSHSNHNHDHGEHHHHHHEHHSTQGTKSAVLDNGVRHYRKQQDTMAVMGWQWPAQTSFKQAFLIQLLTESLALKGVYRLKGVFCLQTGEALFVNGADGQLQTHVGTWSMESRLEIIGLSQASWEHSLKINAL